MSAQVKVVCGSCGNLIGRLVEDSGELEYRLTLGGGGRGNGPMTIFCSEHGWPDLDDAEIRSKLQQRRGRAGRRHSVLGAPVFSGRIDV